MFRFNNSQKKPKIFVKRICLFFAQKLWLEYFFRHFFLEFDMEIPSVLWIDPTPCSNSFGSANNRFHAPFQFESAKECKWNSIIDLEGVISATKSPFFKVSHFNERCANLCSVTNFVSWKFQGFRVSCFIFHKTTLTTYSKVPIISTVLMPFRQN